MTWWRARDMSAVGHLGRLRVVRGVERAETARPVGHRSLP
jgi:hypothetical protein